MSNRSHTLSHYSSFSLSFSLFLSLSLSIFLFLKVNIFKNILYLLLDSIPWSLDSGFMFAGIFEKRTIKKLFFKHVHSFEGIIACSHRVYLDTKNIEKAKKLFDFLIQGYERVYNRSSAYQKDFWIRWKRQIGFATEINCLKWISSETAL